MTLTKDEVLRRPAELPLGAEKGTQVASCSGSTPTTGGLSQVPAHLFLERSNRACLLLSAAASARRVTRCQFPAALPSRPAQGSVKNRLLPGVSGLTHGFAQRVRGFERGIQSSNFVASEKNHGLICCALPDLSKYPDRDLKQLNKSLQNVFLAIESLD